MEIEVSKTYNEEYAKQKAQADTLMEQAKDPVGMIKTAVTLSAKDLVDNDDQLKEKKVEIAHNVVDNAFDQVRAENTKGAKETYFDLNKNDIEPYGANKDTAKGQQKVLVFGSKFFWVLAMATLGFFYIMPIKTLLELFRGLSFKKVEEVSTKEGKNLTVIERKKLGWIGTTIGALLSVVWCGGIIWLNILMPFVFLYIAIGLCFIIGIIVAVGDKKIKTKAKKTNKEQKDINIVECEENVEKTDI